MNHSTRFVEKEHDAWSIYLVGADRATASDTAQIDFFKMRVIEKTKDGSFTGRISSFSVR